MGSNGHARREPARVTADNVKELLHDIDTVLLDCDGVIWTITTTVPNAFNGLHALRKAGKKLLFVTNNNLASLSQFVKKFADRGLQVKEEEIAFPVLALAEHLKKEGFDKKILYFGVEAPKAILREAGFEVVEPRIDPIAETIASLRGNCPDDPDIGAVVVDVDINTTFCGLTHGANILLNNKNCQLFSAATDKTIPIGSSFKIMGPGYFAELMEAFTGRRAQAIGKPSPMMITELLQTKHTFDLERSLFIGDSLLQDMSMAAALGMKTLLVLTGVTAAGDWEAHPPEWVPDYVIDSVADFVHLIS